MFKEMLSAFAGKALGGEKTPLEQVSGGTITAKEKPAPVEGSPVAGTLIDEAKEKLRDGIITTGMDSIFSPIRGKIAGKTNKAYLDSSFPGLNEFDKAGATATQAGAQVSAQSQAQRMQARQQKHEKEMQRENLSTQERMQKRQVDASLAMNQVTAGATIGAAELSSQASRVLAEWNAKLIEQQINASIASETFTWANTAGKKLENTYAMVKDFKAVLTRLRYGHTDLEGATKDTAVLLANSGVKAAGSALNSIADTLLKRVLKVGGRRVPGAVARNPKIGGGQNAVIE